VKKRADKKSKGQQNYLEQFLVQFGDIDEFSHKEYFGTCTKLLYIYCDFEKKAKLQKEFAAVIYCLSKQPII